MKLIGENIHIISKRTKEAILNKDKEYVQTLAKRQFANEVDWIDLNVGPARKQMESSIPWLIETISEVCDVPFSLDTTNYEEMQRGLKALKNTSNALINSTSADPERLEQMGKLAKEYDSNIIALTLSDETGIPKEADSRVEIAFQIVEYLNEAGVENEKIFIDPLVLPIGVDQTQATEALNAIRMFKESFEPAVMTTIGLSNISNGSPKELRPLINIVFAVLAMGCGLDSAIVDGVDDELIRVNKMIETNSPDDDVDDLLVSLHDMARDFGELEEVSFDEEDKKQVEIYKTAQIILNKTIYSHNYLDV